jgi:iron(III) transport system substrate-binding protein
MMRQRVKLAGLLPALGALAGVLASLPALAQTWDETVAAAKKEGKVVFYNNLQPNGIEPLLAKFRAAVPGIQP